MQHVQQQYHAATPQQMGRTSSQSQTMHGQMASPVRHVRYRQPVHLIPERCSSRRSAAMQTCMLCDSRCCSRFGHPGITLLVSLQQVSSQCAIHGELAPQFRCMWRTVWRRSALRYSGVIQQEQRPSCAQVQCAHRCTHTAKNSGHHAISRLTDTSWKQYPGS
jgi:hypothetical protein